MRILEHGREPGAAERQPSSRSDQRSEGQLLCAAGSGSRRVALLTGNPNRSAISAMSLRWDGLLRQYIFELVEPSGGRVAACEPADRAPTGR